MIPPLETTSRLQAVSQPAGDALRRSCAFFFFASYVLNKAKSFPPLSPGRLEHIRGKSKRGGEESQPAADDVWIVKQPSETRGGFLEETIRWRKKESVGLAG